MLNYMDGRNTTKVSYFLFTDSFFADSTRLNCFEKFLDTNQKSPQNMSNKDIAPLAHLLPCGWERVVDDWMREDVPSFDFGGFVVGNQESKGHLFQKASGVIAGIPFLDKIYEKCNCKAQWYIREGEYYEHKQVNPPSLFFFFFCLTFPIQNFREKGSSLLTSQAQLPPFFKQRGLP